MQLDNKKYILSGLKMWEIESKVCNIPLVNTINMFGLLIVELKRLGMKFKPVDCLFKSEKPVNKTKLIYDAKTDNYIYLEIC